jgi:hypothetical protein
MEQKYIYKNYKLFFPLLLNTIVIVIGLLIIFYPTLLSGFTQVQNNTIDPPLVNYFLEHSFQYLFNHDYLGKLWSPNFFYPYKEVLAFSENLFGSAPIYWIFRLFYDSGLAFQFWMITISILNFLAFLYLMRKIEVNHILSTLSSFLFAFGMPRISQLGHLQLFPQFFTPIAILILFNFVKYPTNARIIILLSLTYLQLLAGIYLGWFLAFSLPLFVITAIIIDRKTSSKFSTYWSTNRLKIIVISISWLITTAVTFYPYIKAKSVLGSRPYSEVDQMIPRLQSWFYPPNGNFWHNLLAGISKDLPLPWEHNMFMGLTLIVLSILSIYIISTKRNYLTANKKLIVNTCFIVFLTIFVLSLRFPFGVSLWYIIYHLIPGASVIRGVSRIWLIAYPYLFIAIFVLIDAFLKSLNINKLLLNIVLLIVLFLGIAEQITTNLGSYSKQDFRVVVEELRSLMTQGCNMSYVIPDMTKVDDPYRGITGNNAVMWAGIEANVPVINGYSGNIPPHYDYLDSFSFDGFETSSLIKWLKINSLNKNQGNICLIVHKSFQFNDDLVKVLESSVIKKSSNNFKIYNLITPIPNYYKQDIQMIDFIDNIQTPNNLIQIKLNVKNTSQFTWSSDKKFPISLSYRWYQNNEIADFDKLGDGVRTKLTHSLKPGESLSLTANVLVPNRSGKYYLVFSMVEENMGWFYEQDTESEYKKIPIEVK